MFEITRILTPVVFSDNCRGALRYAASVGSRFDAEVTVLHVLEPLKPMDFDSSIALEALEGSRRDWVHRSLLDLTFDLKHTVQVKELCLPGDPATVIVQTAEDLGANLIVIATHGYGPFRRFLLGSVTAKVLHDASCAVWTGVHLERTLLEHSPAGPEVRHVLCALDFGAQAECTVRWSAGIADAYGANLTLLHVLPPTHGDERQSAGRGEAHEGLSRWAQSIQVKTDTQVVVGSVPEQVAETAKRLGADLLVIGRGHMKGGGRLRSTSYTIIRESPCPVVSV